MSTSKRLILGLAPSGVGWSATKLARSRPHAAFPRVQQGFVEHCFRQPTHCAAWSYPRENSKGNWASPEFLPPAKTRRSSTETSQDASAPAGPGFLGATGLAVCSGLGRPNPAPNPATLPVFRPIPATPHKRLDASGL
ncbi:Putative protein of unknown function [Podospora comata]|uniref:Secreted protein n=1 Tax=Podospora comata TaxID=48703 RepID=A0ABY6SM05_PODCO|nr:Putative protein of unknown function [Podospora comata]